MKELRPFSDLIKEIEYNGEKFIPAARIAALAFNYNDETVKHQAQYWVNESYDYACWYNFETNILKPKLHKCSIGIFRNFDVWAYHKIGEDKATGEKGQAPCNQAKIITNLILWGFIDFKNE